jgi:hypothetical protein
VVNVRLRPPAVTTYCDTGDLGPVGKGHSSHAQRLVGTGTDTIVISSASSKTAIIAAYLLAEGEGVEVVGLTFAGNRESGELIHAMSACEVDLAIIHGPSTDERLVSTNLLGEDRVLVGDVRRTWRPTTPSSSPGRRPTPGASASRNLTRGGVSEGRQQRDFRPFRRRRAERTVLAWTVCRC